MYPPGRARLPEDGLGGAAGERDGLDDAEGPLGRRGDPEALAEVAARVGDGERAAEVAERAAALALLDLHAGAGAARAGVAPHPHRARAQQAHEQRLAVGQQGTRLVPSAREPQPALPGTE